MNIDNRLVRMPHTLLVAVALVLLPALMPSAAAAGRIDGLWDAIVA